MTIDARFSIAIATMAIVAFGCRVVGLIVGTSMGDNPNLRRFLDLLPACAMGAVLGPAMVAMTFVQSVAAIVSAVVFLASGRFLLALAVGSAVLMCERWILAVVM